MITQEQQNFLDFFLDFILCHRREIFLVFIVPNMNILRSAIRTMHEYYDFRQSIEKTFTIDFSYHNNKIYINSHKIMFISQISPLCQFRGLSLDGIIFYNVDDLSKNLPVEIAISLASKENPCFIDVKERLF